MGADYRDIAIADAAAEIVGLRLQLDAALADAATYRGLVSVLLERLHTLSGTVDGLRRALQAGRRAER